MKKILILISLIIILTGCEAIYTIEINGNEFRETLEINNRQRATWGTGNDISYEELIRTNARFYLPTDFRLDFSDLSEYIEGINYYDIELIDTQDNLGLRYDNVFNGINEYRNSTIALNHFSYFDIRRTNDVVYITSGNNNFSFNIHEHLNRFTVRILTDWEILEHNADEVINNVLYWHFTRENYQGREISVQLNENLDQGPGLWQTDADGNFGANTLIMIYAFLLGIGFIIAIFIYIKIKKSNL